MHPKLTFAEIKELKEPWTLWWMHGSHQTTRCMSQSLFILKIRLTHWMCSITCNNASNNNAMIEKLAHLVVNFSPSQVLAQSINLNLMCERIHRIKKKLNILLSPELSQSSSQNNPSFLMIFFYRGKGSKWIDANASGWKKIMLRWTSGSVTSVTTLLWPLQHKPGVLTVKFSVIESPQCLSCPLIQYV